MPFITEEIWLQVAERAGIDGETIMLRPYPEVDAAGIDDDAEAEIEWNKQFILGLRQIRGEMDISPGRQLPVLLENAGASDRERLKRNELLVTRVGRAASVTLLADGEEAPASASAFLGDMRFHVPMAALIDLDAEQARFRKQRDKVAAEFDKATAKLGNANFVNNAPAAVVTQEKTRVADFQVQLAQLDEQLERLESLRRAM